MENCSSQRFETCCAEKAPKMVRTIQPPATTRRCRMISRARRASAPWRASPSILSSTVLISAPPRCNRCGSRLGCLSDIPRRLAHRCVEVGMGAGVVEDLEGVVGLGIEDEPPSRARVEDRDRKQTLGLAPEQGHLETAVSPPGELTEGPS